MKIKLCSKKRGFLLGLFIVLLVSIRKLVLFCVEYFNELNKLAEKYRRYNGVLQQWLRLKNMGKRIDTYFIDRNINSIAIYGMGDLGNRLFEELRSSAVEVVYGIDQNKDNVFSEIPTYNLEDELPAVDAIIITPYLSYAQISMKLIEKFQGNIISLEDVIYAVY